jgi:hydroxylamine reductase
MLLARTWNYSRTNKLQEVFMFCYQCEQAAQGTGCTKVGVCGNDPELSSLQDLLVYAMKGLALQAVEGRKVGVVENGVNIFITKGLFSTLTNVNFDLKGILNILYK